MNVDGLPVMEFYNRVTEGRMKVLGGSVLYALQGVTKLAGAPAYVNDAYA